MIQKQWKKGLKQLDILYPNKKYGGVYSLSTLIMEHITNQQNGWIGKRIFLDEGKITAGLIAVSLQYEGDVDHLKDMMKRDGISFDKKKRKQVMFGGGYVVFDYP